MAAEIVPKVRLVPETAKAMTGGIRSAYVQVIASHGMLHAGGMGAWNAMGSHASGHCVAATTEVA